MLKTTTVGSYPRKDKPKDTLRKPTVSEEEALDMVQWAVEDLSLIHISEPTRP